MKLPSANVAQLSAFSDLVDARTPAEFAEDHLPGAINLPVLEDAERVTVGTLYKQVSPFVAKRHGAGLVAANIARHLAGPLADKPPGWRPLVYCWRGGLRSGSMVTWLRQIGWDARQLEGGYKAWRTHVLAQLAEQPQQFDFHVICGPTGSAKTRVLGALAERGAQVLDLEGLAAHKGSVLGALPGRPQPSQKGFDTTLYSTLAGLDSARPVFVEAESRKIGAIHLPEALLQRMRAAPCVAIDASHDARIAYLVRDYAYLGEDGDNLARRLNFLHRVQSRERLDRWQTLARNGEITTLYTELITHHYDPLYQRSQNANYVQFGAALRVTSDDLSDAGIGRIADEVLAALRS